ncbi:glutamate receptor ionotropic, kainate 3 isoform X1 [Drosophila willistoni]|uniref:glutamate receptor ionotropic, kainate 3 isoform X1 n=1 Tax=Drosophila willistoni TaxID=7260 RepID=UPI000C26C5AA|nr:glutamate receptor ionotropic, kainate 3 isoform X1 [Drosophila willistoni]
MHSECAYCVYCCRCGVKYKQSVPKNIATWTSTPTFYKACLIHVILSMVLIANALPPIIRVGAIFTENERESSLESAFKYAIYRINKEKEILPNTQLVYDIEYVPRDDSFRTTKKVCRQLDAGVQAIFGPTDSLLAGHVQSICEAYDIPHIEVRIDLESNGKEFSINLYPSYNILTMAYRDLMMYLNWTKVAVIYEEDYGLFNLMHSSTELRTEMYIRQASPDTYRQVLRAIRQKEIYKIIVDTNPANIKQFFRSILQLQMNDHRYHYMFTTFDLETYDLEDFRYNSVNITAFRLVDVGSKRYLDVIEHMQKLQHSGLDLIHGQPYLKTEAALMFDSVYTFAAGLQSLHSDSGLALTFKNLSCSSDQTWGEGLSLYNYINSATVDGLTGNVNFIEGRRTKFKIDILKLKQEQIQKVGYWEPDRGVNISDPTAFYDSNIANITLVVMTREERPYVMVKEDANLTGNARFEGFCIDLLKAIAQQVGFQYKIELVPDNMYGVYIPETNSWNGIVQELMERRADLAVASMTINYARESVIDFTKPFMNLGIGILFKVPTSQPTRLFSFMNPLAIEIWLYVLAAYILVSFALFVMARFSPYEWKNPHPCYKETDIVVNQFTISNSFWFITGTFLRQGSGLNPKISDRAQTKFFSFMNPLAIEIWVYIAFGYILVSICIWIVARLSPVEWVNSKPPCSMACDHIIHKIRKTHYNEDHLELTYLPSIKERNNGHTEMSHDQRRNASLKSDQEENVVFDLDEKAQAEFVDAKEVGFDEVTSDCDSETVELISIQNDFTLKNSFWFAIGALMQQGSDLYPRATSTRIVGGCWFFFCLIIISSYTANLAAFLTVERMISPIESASDLAEQTEISYGTLEGGSTMTFFRDSKIGIYQKMWRYMENRKSNVFVKTYEDGIKRVMEGNYAFLMESTMLDYAVQRDCNLTQIGGLLDSKGYGIATPKGSIWRDKISLAILELQEKGIIQILYDKWWKNTGDVCNRDDKSKESKANALGVENIGGVFVVLLCGLALAVVVAIFEFCWNSKKNLHTENQSLCSEMAEELRFAMHCHGSKSKQRPALKRNCLKCATGSTYVPTTLGVPNVGVHYNYFN